MKTLFLGVGACSLAIALLAALGGALRPLLLTALTLAPVEPLDASKGDASILTSLTVSA